MIRLLVLTCLIGAPARAKYGGGSGTAEDPYRIWTAEQMNAVGAEPNDWDKHFKLMADIDLAAYQNDSFNLIGYRGATQGTRAFRGVFDGDGHTLSNLTYIIEGPDPRDGEQNQTDGYGLFRYLAGDVRNLGLINPTIGPAPTCAYYEIRQVGALAGYCLRGSITNCCVRGGHISGDDRVGGLAGTLSSGVSTAATMSDCYASCTVSCSRGMHPIWQMPPGHSFGGLAGMSDGTILRCHARGNVEAAGAVDAGGLIGYLHSGGTVDACFATGQVAGGGETAGLGHTGGLIGCADGDAVVRASYSAGPVFGTTCVGGLVGRAMGLTIRDCYSRGPVSGREMVGGLVGELSSDSRLERCYAAGMVSGEVKTRTGGLIGAGRVSLLDCFWDRETSRVDSSAGGVGLTTDEMQSLWTYYSAGWDFAGEAFNGTEETWKMCCGRPIYPKLAWEPMLVGDFMDPEGVGLEDLAFMAEYWLEAARMPCGGADLNFDEQVNLKDLALLTLYWHQGARTVIFETTLDTAPDWTAEGQWQFGVPTGGGGRESGYPDPTGGYTGENVFGVNLRGDYALAIDGPHYLTAGPFDCRGYHDMKLRFTRWLNTDEAEYVKATVEASLDGTAWFVLWENEDTEAILADDAWRPVAYSFGPMADNQKQVYVRWGYEITDEQAWPLSGWNIDDIILTGIGQ